MLKGESRCFEGVTLIRGEQSVSKMCEETTTGWGCVRGGDIDLFLNCLELSADMMAVHTVSSPAPNDRDVSAWPHSMGVRTGGARASSGVESHRSWSQSTTSPDAGLLGTSSLTHCNASAIRESGESEGSILRIQSSSRRNLDHHEESMERVRFEILQKEEGLGGGHVRMHKGR